MDSRRSTELARSQSLAASIGDQPRQRLDAAFRAFDTLGATPWRTTVERQLREHGYPVPQPTVDASAAATLTDLDRQLIRYVAEGHTNQEIGKRLSYSPKTIEAYLSRLYRKMGCSSRIGLLRAIQPGDLLALR